MEFNFTTYIFELINFFVLLWLLKKILYVPIINNLKKRKEYIEDKFSLAEKKEKELEDLKLEYDNLILKFENQKKEALLKLQHEINTENNILKKRFQEEKIKENERFFSDLEKEKEVFFQNFKETLINTSVDFAIKTLSHFSENTINKRLIHLSMEAINAFSDNDITEIINDLNVVGSINIESAITLSEDYKDTFSNYFLNKFKKNFKILITEKPILKAGIKIYLGTKVIDSSLHSQLEIFKESLKENVGKI